MSEDCQTPQRDRAANIPRPEGSAVGLFSSPFPLSMAEGIVSLFVEVFNTVVSTARAIETQLAAKQLLRDRLERFGPFFLLIDAATPEGVKFGIVTGTDFTVLELSPVPSPSTDIAPYFVFLAGVRPSMKKVLQEIMDQLKSWQSRPAALFLETFSLSLQRLDSFFEDAKAMIQMATDCGGKLSALLPLACGSRVWPSSRAASSKLTRIWRLSLSRTPRTPRTRMSFSNSSQNSSTPKNPVSSPPAHP